MYLANRMIDKTRAVVPVLVNIICREGDTVN